MLQKRGIRGSFNLSINAIVILVLAVGFLALGIGLISSMQSKAENRLEEALGTCTAEPSQDYRLAVSPESVALRDGKPKVVCLGYYHTGEMKYCTFAVDPTGKIEMNFGSSLLASGETMKALMLINPDFSSASINVMVWCGADSSNLETPPAMAQKSITIRQ